MCFCQVLEHFKVVFSHRKSYSLSCSRSTTGRSGETILAHSSLQNSCCVLPTAENHSQPSGDNVHRLSNSWALSTLKRSAGQLNIKAVRRQTHSISTRARSSILFAGPPLEVAGTTKDAETRRQIFLYVSASRSFWFNV